MAVWLESSSTLLPVNFKSPLMYFVTDLQSWSMVVGEMADSSWGAEHTSNTLGLLQCST